MPDLPEIFPVISIVAPASGSPGDGGGAGGGEGGSGAGGGGGGGAASCRTLTREPLESRIDPERGFWLLFSATDTRTVPLPCPELPVRRIHDSVALADQVQSRVVATVTLAFPPCGGNDIFPELAVMLHLDGDGAVTDEVLVLPHAETPKSAANSAQVRPR